MKKIIVALLAGVLLTAFGCSGYYKSNTSSQLMYGAALSTAPVLNNLAISGVTSVSVTLAQPTLAVTGNPQPTVSAYIGVNGTINVSGTTVTGAAEGPIDVSSAGYSFTGLTLNTVYRIIVIAQNVNGYSVKQILQSTSGIAPVLNALALSATDSSSITLTQPTFSTAGNPAPTVNAYIGLNGAITVAGATVIGTIVEGPVDVSSSNYQFTGLLANSSYRVIVVAQNATGYSVMQIVQSTAGIAPSLNGLTITPNDSSHITLTQPTFSIAGNPAPTVEAYIGVDGAITVSGSTVSGTIVEGPVDVSAISYQFGGLAPNTTYRVIVVAQNASGYSVQQIIGSTAGIAPVLNTLSIPLFDASSITLAQPAFLTAGNPSPTVYAYIGVNGSIFRVGSAVFGTILEGPVDVSSGAYQFNGLASPATYRIIVISQNAQGYSAQEITQTIP